MDNQSATQNMSSQDTSFHTVFLPSSATHPYIYSDTVNKLDSCIREVQYTINLSAILCVKHLPPR